jgi:adenine specific DNA methylase Mod
LNKGNESLEKLVETILSLKEKDSKTDISELEQQIDLLVYHLYGLTYDEVLIVDPETPITREEYEKTI